MYDTNLWTYGSELELADLDTRKILPEGNKWDYKDGSIANSNGLANDPKKEFNIFRENFYEFFKRRIPHAGFF